MTTEPVTVTRRYRGDSGSQRLALLAVLGVGWYFYDRSVHKPWAWSLLYPGVAALLLVVAYVVSHTSLTYSPTLLTKRLAGRVRKLDLTQLVTAGVLANGRFGNSGAVTGLYFEDRQGTRMTLSVVNPYPNASQWASYLCTALKESDAVIGDRVVSTLDRLASAV